MNVLRSLYVEDEDGNNRRLPFSTSSRCRRRTASSAFAISENEKKEGGDGTGNSSVIPLDLMKEETKW